MPRSPIGAGIVYPLLEVLADETKRATLAANADRGDAASLRRIVEPCSRDAELDGNLCGLEKVYLTWLVDEHVDPGHGVRQTAKGIVRVYR